MEGLEASVVSVNQLERTSRIDSEFFQKRFLRSATLIEQWERDSIVALTRVSDGNHFSISDDFVENGIPYYRGQDVTGRFFVETASPIHITREAYDRKYMKRSYLKRGDVLLSIVGTIGELSLVASDQPATCSCKLAILRPREVLPEYLAVFLRSEDSQNQIERLTRGAVQKGLILEDMDQLWVPSLSEEFEKRIAQVVHTSRNTQEQSEHKQKEAEDTLLAALGLEDRTPPGPLSYTAPLSEIAGDKRLDAQFHRPKFKELQAIHESRFELQYLHGLVLKGRTVPYSDTGAVPIIRSGDLTDIDDEAKLLRADASEPIFFLRKGDVLISSIGFGSIGKVQVFDKEGSYGTVSEVTVVRQKKLNPSYLAAYLRSKAGQLQIDRYITGATGQLHLYPRSVEKFFVPILPTDKQAEFEHIYNSVRQLKTASRQLLEVAKRAVEIAIENGEAAAMAFLDQAEEVN